MHSVEQKEFIKDILEGIREDLLNMYLPSHWEGTELRLLIQYYVKEA